ncbi:MAG: hypothetical protein ABIO79_14155 [Ferruginibacter sp.]
MVSKVDIELLSIKLHKEIINFLSQYNEEVYNNAVRLQTPTGSVKFSVLFTWQVYLTQNYNAFRNTGLDIQAFFFKHINTGG